MMTDRKCSVTVFVYIFLDYGAHPRQYRGEEVHNYSYAVGTFQRFWFPRSRRDTTFGIDVQFSSKGRGNLPSVYATIAAHKREKRRDSIANTRAALSGGRR